MKQIATYPVYHSSEHYQCRECKATLGVEIFEIYEINGRREETEMCGDCLKKLLPEFFHLFTAEELTIKKIIYKKEAEAKYTLSQLRGAWYAGTQVKETT